MTSLLVALSFIITSSVVYTPVKLAIFVETSVGVINVPWPTGFKTVADCEASATEIYNVLTGPPSPVVGIQMMSCYVPDSINI